MPKKPVTTKEEMVNAAFELIRREGHEALTVRTLAADLGCSTQPVMYQFAKLELLKEAAYQKADAFHTEYLLAGEDLLGIGIRYIRFAKEETNLFRFLFQSGHFSGMTIRDMILAPETAEVMKEVGCETGLPPEAAAAFFEPLYAAVHGYASLIADNAVEYDPETIRRSLIMFARGLMRRETE